MSVITRELPVHEEIASKPGPEFVITDEPQFHIARRKAIAKAHPEVDDLVVRRPDSALYVAGCVGIMMTISVYLTRWDAPWWSVFAAAWLVGAVVDHALWVLIHDLTHDNVFPWTWANSVCQIIANLPIVFPAAITFKHFHRRHHAQMGEVYTDADMASPWEQRLFGHSTLGKATWMLFFAVFQSLRTIRFGAVDFGGLLPYLILNWVVQLSFDVAVLYYLGWKALVFMTASSLFSVGLHPVGARWIAEHFAVRADQETYSYYGPLNVVALNVGYHNEHHDFPSVPWQNLPRLRATAPEFYDSLWHHSSYVRLLWDFITNPQYTLETRIARLPRGSSVPNYLRSPTLESRFAALAKSKGEASAQGPDIFSAFDADRAAAAAKEGKEATEEESKPAAAPAPVSASASSGSKGARGATSRRRNVAE